jgi:hypothetical protein
MKFVLPQSSLQDTCSQKVSKDVKIKWGQVTLPKIGLVTPSTFNLLGVKCYWWSGTWFVYGYFIRWILIYVFFFCMKAYGLLVVNDIYNHINNIYMSCSLTTIIKKYYVSHVTTWISY